MKRLILCLLGFMLVPMLSSCIGISQSEYERLRTDYLSLQSNYNSLQDKYEQQAVNLANAEKLSDKVLEQATQIAELESANQDIQSLYDQCDSWASDIESKYPPRRFADYNEIVKWRQTAGIIMTYKTQTDDCEILQYRAARDGFLVSIDSIDDLLWCTATTESGGFFKISPWGYTVVAILDDYSVSPISLTWGEESNLPN